jgi:hypothetical protein
VEEITRVGTWPERERRTLCLKPSPFQLITFSMILGFMALILVARVLAQNAVALPNPFASYADIFPGQPGDGVEARGFFCIINYYGALTGSPDEHCVLRPEMGMVSEVRVMIAHHIVLQIEFILRRNELRVGDLMVLFGTPYTSGNRDMVYFSWPIIGANAMAISATGQLSAFVPVHSIYFYQA